MKEPLSRRRLLKEAAVGIPAAAVLGKVSYDLVAGDPFAQEIPVKPEPKTILLDATLPFEPKPVVQKQELHISETAETKIMDRLGELVKPYEAAFNLVIQHVQDPRLAPLAEYKAVDDGGILALPRLFIAFTHNTQNKPLVNDQDLPAWLTGNGSVLTRDDQTEPKVQNGSDLIQISLGAFTENIINTTYAHSKSRLRNVDLSLPGENPSNEAHMLIINNNPHLVFTGDIDWQTDVYTKDRPLDVAGLRRLFHELIHAGQPNITQIQDPMNASRFTIEPASGSMPHILAYNRVWMEAITNNFEFINMRFSRQPGDEVGPMLYAGTKGIPHGVNEVNAMLCTDAVLPVDTELSLQEWPQDIVNAVGMTLNFVKYGNQSELQPMSGQEVLAMRYDLVNVYNLYMATNFPDIPLIK